MIKITFPDGNFREYEAGITGWDIAGSISPRLQQDVLAAGVNGQVWDLHRPINGTMRKASMHFGTPVLT